MMIVKYILRPRYRALLKLIVNYILEPALRYTDCSLDPRQRMLYNAFRYAEHNQIEGDYLEFGVYRGQTFIHAFHLGRRYVRNMRFYAFDSFQGLPQVKENDANKYSVFKKSDYACSLEEFTSILRKNDVEFDKVEIVSGWYDAVLTPETRVNLPISAASIVWIDCDLYESTVPVLKFITDYLVDGSIIIFDDWFCFRGHPARGEQRAFSEWLKDNPSLRAAHLKSFGPFGNSFIINKD